MSVMVFVQVRDWDVYYERGRRSIYYILSMKLRVAKVTGRQGRDAFFKGEKDIKDTFITNINVIIWHYIRYIFFPSQHRLIDLSNFWVQPRGRAFSARLQGGAV